MAQARTLYVAEPRVRYAARPPLVVDNSLLCAILFDEPECSMAQSRLLGHALHAPALLDHEVANVTLMKQRKDFPTERARQALRAYREFNIELHDVDLDGHYEIAHRYGLTSYDGAYLWLADQLHAPLATLDRRLRDAAQAHFNDAR